MMVHIVYVNKGSNKLIDLIVEREDVRDLVMMLETAGVQYKVYMGGAQSSPRYFGLKPETAKGWRLAEYAPDWNAEKSKIS